MKGKLSLAMATFNGEKYLREQLDSIYSQSLVPDEIVVVDDCSCDNTKDILKEYHQKCGLKYYINDINLGVNKNFEKAISYCTGEFVALSDQDDIWMPYKLEKSYKKLQLIEGNEPSLVSSAVIIVDADLNVLSEPKQLKDSHSFAATLLGHHSQGCTLIMNRALIDYILPIPNDSRLLFDVYIGITAAMIGNKYNISEPLMYYRIHSSNAIFRVNTNKVSLSKRIKNNMKNRFPLLITEGRLYNMSVIATYQSKNFIAERKSLYNRLLALRNNGYFIKKLSIIFSIKELTIKRRMKILCCTIVSHMTRMILNNNDMLNIPEADYIDPN